MSQAPLKVAVIGAGPAGIYASDILVKKTGGNVQIDLIEQMPAPFGLIRYGVAPDHPRIKGIVNSCTASWRPSRSASSPTCTSAATSPSSSSRSTTTP